MLISLKKANEDFMDLLISYVAVILIAFIVSTTRGDRKNILLKTLIFSIVGILFFTIKHFVG